MQELKKNAIHRKIDPIPDPDAPKPVAEGTAAGAAPDSGGLPGGPVRDYSMDFAVDDLPEDLARDAEMRDGTPGGSGITGRGGRPVAAGGAIPDDTMIQHAKEKRERMRQGQEWGDNQSFIPLHKRSEADEPEPGQDKWGESRLLTEDQEDGGEATFEDAMGDRVGFGDPKMREKQEARRRKEAMDRHGVAGDLEGEDGDEMLDWEMDLIRKGTGGQSVGEDPTGSLRKSMRQERGSARHSDMDGPDGPVSATLDEVQKELRLALTSMNTLHESHTREVTGMDSELQSMRIDIEQADRAKLSASQRYELFQRMRDYTLDVLDLLDEKMGPIEDSEDVILDMRVKRGEARRAVEAQYARDAKEEVEASGGESHLDEFGRDPSEARRLRWEARRARRAAKGETRPEGWSSEEEDEEETASFRAKANEARSDAERGFADVEDKYSTIKAVKEHFMKWKRDHGSSYTDAYVSKSLPVLFAPFVRVELITWEPLVVPEVDNKDMVWFKELQDYGEMEGEGGMHDDDEDQDLVPRVVMSAAMPLASDAIRNEWSPYSTSATKQARRLYRELSSFVEPSNDEMKDLLREMRDKFAGAADEAVLPATKESSELGARLFGRCCKLLQHIGMLDGIIVSHALQRIAFDKLIDLLLVPHLQALEDKADAARKAQMMIDTLPAGWIASGIDTVAATKNMLRCVKALGGNAADSGSENWQRAMQVAFE